MRGHFWLLSVLPVDQHAIQIQTPNVQYQYPGRSAFVSTTYVSPAVDYTVIGSGNDPDTGDILPGRRRLQYASGMSNPAKQPRHSFASVESGVDRFGRARKSLWKSRSASMAQADIDNTTGSAWATPAYDRAGNMIGIPHPGASVPSSTVAWNPMTQAQWNTFTEAEWNVFELDSAAHAQGILSARYDAWNRLVSIRNGNDLVVENVYDARGYRIRKDSYVSGELDEERHYYYTPGWQVVEERVGGATTADRQYVWGLRYIDDLVERQRDSNGNGTLDETRYGLQDGNWNMIALSEPGGTISERFAYTAYGEPEFLNGSGTVHTSSASNFETLYAGYRWDRNLTDLPPVYYVRNRFLLPQIGTWNKRDPIGYTDSTSLTVYVTARVVSRIDPYGLFGGGPSTPSNCDVTISTISSSDGTTVSCDDPRFRRSRIVFPRGGPGRNCAACHPRMAIRPSLGAPPPLISPQRPASSGGPDGAGSGAATVACTALVVAIPSDPTDVVGTPVGLIVACIAGVCYLVEVSHAPSARDGDVIYLPRGCPRPDIDPTPEPRPGAGRTGPTPIPTPRCDDDDDFECEFAETQEGCVQSTCRVGGQVAKCRWRLFRTAKPHRYACECPLGSSEDY